MFNGIKFLIRMGIRCSLPLIVEIVECAAKHNHRDHQSLLPLSKMFLNLIFLHFQDPKEFLLQKFEWMNIEYDNEIPADELTIVKKLNID